jgi:hypothetical protein
LGSRSPMAPRDHRLRTRVMLRNLPQPQIPWFLPICDPRVLRWAESASASASASGCAGFPLRSCIRMVAARPPRAVRWTELTYQGSLVRSREPDVGVDRPRKSRVK